MNKRRPRLRSCVLSLGTIAFSFLLAAQNLETVKLDEPSKVIEPEVQFIEQVPVIDGALDNALQSLLARHFAMAYKTKADSLVPVSYRLGYGAGFFYLYVEAEAGSLVFNDRAYQNGDGFVLLLAKPQANGDPTDEFYELACSAVNKPSLEWTRRMFWYVNVDRLFVPTGDEARLEFREGNGKISFELLLPWVDVRPYHPWFSDGIGFNLTFTKGLERGGRMYFGIVDDESVGAEYKKRRYALLRFQKPSVQGKPQTFVSIQEGHCTQGDSLHGVAVTVSTQRYTETIAVRLQAGDGDAVTAQISYPCNPGMTKKELALGTNSIQDGGYRIRWSSLDRSSAGTCGLSVLPSFDFSAAGQRLENVRNVLSPSTYNTLQFLMKEIQSKLRGLKKYETCYPERLKLLELQRSFNEAEKGIDPFAGRSGFTRRAYRSHVDSTLQPYVVYVSKNLDKTRNYPLLVYLHGSASDETNLQSAQKMIPDGFIALGPFGRGPSNGFARDHAQDDIAEAIAAVVKTYPVDTTNIILSGFSMGGYGVYRTFYETPSKYKAIAIFSGGPDMGERYAPDTSPPDFRDAENLKSFRNIPVFIFHGEQDMNVPIEATRDLVAKLRNAGARVEARIEPDKGHESPSREGIEMFKEWVGQVLNKGK
jgi:predicted esterase